ncbi:MAG: hypothetical protein ACXACB_13160, partial [Promethearchaeota archaeon]
ANFLNMIYFLMDIDDNIILILNFLTNFFSLFGAIFILTVNRIILESTIIFPVKRQNMYILFYGILLFCGMLILILLGLRFDRTIPKPNEPFFGVKITADGAPWWGLIFFIYVISFSALFVVIPIIRTSLRIYMSFETKALKKKWLTYFIGSLGTFSIFYLIIIGNLVNDIGFKNIVSIYTISVLLWGSLMYYGIGFKLKT